MPINVAIHSNENARQEFNRLAIMKNVDIALRRTIKSSYATRTMSDCRSLIEGGYGTDSNSNSEPNVNISKELTIFETR